jgi:hypothetical protein
MGTTRHGIESGALARMVALAASALWAACESPSPPREVPTYQCTDEPEGLRCRVDETCVRHYSLSRAMPERFACAPDNGCATPMRDYCEGHALGATCGAGPVMGADGGMEFVTVASCSYP